MDLDIQILDAPLTVKNWEEFSMDDWWTIERLEHEHKSWEDKETRTQPADRHYPSYQYTTVIHKNSARLDRARMYDIEGCGQAMLEVGRAIKNRFEFSDTRVAVSPKNGGFVFWSPRNSDFYVWVSAARANDLADKIASIVGKVVE